MLEISAVTARRYVMGRQGLWPGRRWRGLDGAGAAMRAVEDLQLDPLVVVARAHDLMLHSRVLDYAIGDWATLTYERREFFEWGGWLAVRPIEELPYFRVVMRRERDHGHWRDVQKEHAAAIQDVLAVLRERGEVSNRDFAMHARTRIDDYRGRKDSALALHYLWRIGDVMVTRRERFERVYALTEAVAPAEALREVDAEEADEVLLRKQIAADGLTRLPGLSGLLRRPVPAAELAERRARWLAAGDAIEVRVEGWRATQLAVGADSARIEALERGQIAHGLGTDGDHHRRGGGVPVAARPGQRPRPGEAAVRLRLRLGGLQARRAAQLRLLHDADPVGRPAGRPVRPQARPVERHARHQRAVAGGSSARPRRQPLARPSNGAWRGSCGSSAPSVSMRARSRRPRSGAG